MDHRHDEALIPAWMSQTPTGLTEDQTPDTGAEAFVKDMMRDQFGEVIWRELQIEVNDLADYVIPLGILGALEWIAVCGWWAWTYTGIFHSSESYKWVFRYSSYDKEADRDIVYEYDPDKLMMFREDDEENAFEDRFNNPGLTDKERAEAVQFLIQDVFEEMDREAPDPFLVEVILYCAFMWVLSDNGREWLCEIDEVWNCIDSFGVAFMDQWQNMLLDPRNMECTEREVGSCAFCQNSLYCVAGAELNEDWLTVCNDCLCVARDQGHVVDEYDTRLAEPHCPSRGGACLNTECPHSPLEEEDIVEAMQEAGSRRLERWRGARLEANEPRKIAGRTVDEIVDFFR